MLKKIKDIIDKLKENIVFTNTEQMISIENQSKRFILKTQNKGYFYKHRVNNLYSKAEKIVNLQTQYKGYIHKQNLQMQSKRLKK